MKNMKDMDSATENEKVLEWWESFDGILDKLRELRDENLELKKENAILKQTKTRRKKSKPS